LHPYLTHGVQQFASETFDLATCERLGLPVVRRPFPGGAEYCDVNQLLFQ
jgi:lipoate-protein ligase A